MQQFWGAVDLFLAALFAILLAFMGALTRLFHEHVHERGELSWRRVAFALPGAVIMGVIGTASGQYLHAAWGMPEITGGALGGALGYLGPTILTVVANEAVKRWGQSKTGDE